jgi:hypothetical protein
MVLVLAARGLAEGSVAGASATTAAQIERKIRVMLAPRLAFYADRDAAHHPSAPPATRRQIAETFHHLSPRTADEQTRR